VRTFTITVADEDGVVLDSTEVSEDEFKQARDNGAVAKAIFAELSVGVL